MRQASAVVVAPVHYRSAGMLVQAVRGLVAQEGVHLEIHIVECGADGTVETVEQEFPGVVVHRPAANLGYCAGNNIVIERLRENQHLLVVNPDVRLPDTTTVAQMLTTLVEHSDLGAVAPLIRTHEGMIEYLGSVVDTTRAQAHHTDTMLEGLPDSLPSVIRLPWINGACWLLRSEALRDTGALDERFFLFYEEVDWALRASRAGWGVGLLTQTEVEHTRSASFGTSTKGAYYYWRNRWLLFSLHARDGEWRRTWQRDWLRFVGSPRHWASGAATNALLGGVDARRGRFGPRPMSA